MTGIQAIDIPSRLASGIAEYPYSFAFTLMRILTLRLGTREYSVNFKYTKPMCKA